AGGDGHGSRGVGETRSPEGGRFVPADRLARGERPRDEDPAHPCAERAHEVRRRALAGAAFLLERALQLASGDPPRGLSERHQPPPGRRAPSSSAAASRSTSPRSIDSGVTVTPKSSFVALPFTR